MFLNTPRDAPNRPGKPPPKRHLPHRMLKLTNQHAQCRTRKHERQGAQRYHWPQSVPSQQFQVLFNSLFKVLFIFPSRYLFAIGLSPVFSLRWNLPPDWSCIPKQLDSAKAPRGATGTRPTGLSPSLVPHSRGLGPRPPQGQRSKDYNSEAAGAPDFQVGLFPVHSPLLGESWLVSFPPLSDMLKFGG